MDCKNCKCCQSKFLVLKDFWLDHDVLIRKGQIITEPINPEWRPRLVQEIFPALENCREAAIYIAGNQGEDNEIENLLNSQSEDNEIKNLLNSQSEIDEKILKRLKELGLIACFNCNRCNDVVFELNDFL